MKSIGRVAVALATFASSAASSAVVKAEEQEVLPVVAPPVDRFVSNPELWASLSYQWELVHR